MNATKTRKPRQRRHHERSVKLLLPALPEAGIGIILARITQDGESCDYWIKPVPTDFGLGYRLEKDSAEPGAEDTAYDVLLEIEGDTCTCKGHTYGGYCKHVDCLRVLHTRGLLPLPSLPVPDEDELGERCGQCCHPDTPF